MVHRGGTLKRKLLLDDHLDTTSVAKKSVPPQFAYDKHEFDGMEINIEVLAVLGMSDNDTSE